MAARTFKVESKRADKSFPMTSIQLSQFVGGELNEAFPHIQADMHTPRGGGPRGGPGFFAAYVHANPHPPGAGGLPVGVGGPPSPALWRDRQPRGLLDDGQAGGWPWRWSTSTPTPTPPLKPRRRCWTWPGCLPPGAAASPSMWSPLQRFRRNSAAAAPSPSSPCSCAGS